MNRYKLHEPKTHIDWSISIGSKWVINAQGLAANERIKHQNNKNRYGGIGLLPKTLTITSQEIEDNGQIEMALFPDILSFSKRAFKCAECCRISIEFVRNYYGRSNE